MTVRCPHCTSHYLLPDHPLGPRGGRVRCRTCSGHFEVGRDPDPAEGGCSVGTPGAPAGPTAAILDSHGAARSPGGEPADRCAFGWPNAARRPAAAGRAGALPTLPALGREAWTARQVVEELAASGPAMKDARARGRLFHEAGPVLLAAFDEYRRRAGAEAPATAFLEALRDRWGIDL